MPRPASVAVAGYYPLPTELIGAVAALIDTRPAYRPTIAGPDYRGGPLYAKFGKYLVLDPCAGDGEAIIHLVRQWFPRQRATPEPRWSETALAHVAEGNNNNNTNAPRFGAPSRFVAPSTATVALTDSGGRGGPEVALLSCEMEKARAARLNARVIQELPHIGGRSYHADALTLAVRTEPPTKPGASLLYLNPPYADDRQFGRLEQRFLAHYTQALIPGQGIVVFVVPYYALSASASYLARHYRDIRCYRFPDPFYAQFRQVVLVARRAKNSAGTGTGVGTDESALLSEWLWQQDSAANSVVQLITSWAEHPETLPVLGESEGEGEEAGHESGTAASAPASGPVLKLAEQGKAGLTLEPMQLDMPALLKLTPLWQAGRTGTSTSATNSARATSKPGGLTDPGSGAALVASYGPARELGLDKTLADLVGQPFPVAAPPQPAHLAMALAAGIFNGHEIQPDDPHTTGLPDLLVKGVFSRAYTTVSHNTDREGEITSSLQVQQPFLKVVVLDLSRCEYHEIKGLSESSPTSASANTKNKDSGGERAANKDSDKDSRLDIETLVEQALTNQNQNQPVTNAAATGNSKIVKVADLSLTDLLHYYGKSLTALMAEQFPALHQPAKAAHQLVLPALPRQLFKVQEQAVMATLKLLGRGENPLLVGQPGVGKTTMSAAIMAALSEAHFVHTIGQLKQLGHLEPEAALKPVRRVLVVCPPINTATWAVEIPAVLPGAKVVVVESGSDLALVDNDESNASQSRDQAGAGLTIYLLSRETAKLGHGWRSGAYEMRHKFTNPDGSPRHLVELHCPECGATLTENAERLVRGRLRCTHQPLVALDNVARLAEKLAAQLSRLTDPQLGAGAGAGTGATKGPGENNAAETDGFALKEVRALTRRHSVLKWQHERQDLARALELGKKTAPSQETNPRADRPWCEPFMAQHFLKELGRAVVVAYHATAGNENNRVTTLASALLKLAWGLLAVPETSQTVAQLAEELYRQSLAGTEDKQSQGKTLRRTALELLLMAQLVGISAPGQGQGRGELTQVEVEGKLRRRYYTKHRRAWDDFDQTRARLLTGGAVAGPSLTLSNRAGTGNGSGIRPKSGRGGAEAATGWKTYSVTASRSVDEARPNPGSAQFKAYGFGLGSHHAVQAALKELTRAARFKLGPVCGAFLYQAAPKPRRFALAKFISRYRRRFFDLLIIDELQEYASTCDHYT